MAKLLIRNYDEDFISIDVFIVVFICLNASLDGAFCIAFTFISIKGFDLIKLMRFASI